ncbi:hypothetical protein [Aestuariibacter salexigens]|uniref:hypothetical protein n=1 Tax=Aestuariibacter salexigens TaxID=226010 RepID=UPI0003F4FCE4|nr:hypothetical protein [Aestuariibacter salexigens]
MLYQLAYFRYFMLLLGTLLFAPLPGVAKPIDVQIKGFDDGVKSTKQQDYEQAVLFAKRTAIERAGVTVKSVTTTSDFQLQSDFIESQAQAILLPGFTIIDIGYQEDGTYLVILSGKIDQSDTASASVDDSPLFNAMQQLINAPDNFTYNLGEIGYYDVKRAYFVSNDRFVIEHNYRNGQLILDEFDRDFMNASGRYRTAWDSGDVSLTFAPDGSASGIWKALLGSGEVKIERR